MNTEPKTVQIERFTTDNVIATKKLKKMTKDQLIYHFEQLEKHTLQLDKALTYVMENIQSIKRAKK